MRDDGRHDARIGPEKIRASYARVGPYLRRTPVIDLEPEAFSSEARITLKLESLQHTGVFKTRGAFNRVLSSGKQVTRVVAASGGNHGIAVAYVARRLNLAADIFVPSIASPVKQQRIRDLGATVHVSGDVYADALASSKAFLAAHEALSVHAYDHPDVVAGQGTVALEWESQSPDLDTVLVAVGGGGLVGGVCAWYSGRTKVVAVEPESTCALYAARAAGKVTEVPVGGVAADSLGASAIGTIAFQLTNRYLHDSVLVADDAIRDAQQQLWHTLRIAAEPGGATALAALISGVYRPQAGERVGIIICGGNVDLTSLADGSKE